MIRSATDADAQQIADIYNYYIEHTVVTFEESRINATEIARRLEAIQQLNLPWLVADDDGRVVGYAYAARWAVRSAYRHTVETTVYLDQEATGQGWGTRLYTELFRQLKELSVHVAIGGITLPNAASVALHEKFGLQKAAHYHEVGRKFDRWLDVGYWQVILDHS